MISVGDLGRRWLRKDPYQTKIKTVLTGTSPTTPLPSKALLGGVIAHKPTTLTAL